MGRQWRKLVGVGGRIRAIYPSLLRDPRPSHTVGLGLTLLQSSWVKPGLGFKGSSWKRWHFFTPKPLFFYFFFYSFILSYLLPSFQSLKVTRQLGLGESEGSTAGSLGQSLPYCSYGDTTPGLGSKCFRGK